jgi:hypothetical protein
MEPAVYEIIGSNYGSYGRKVLGCLNPTGTFGDEAHRF